jgi:hypothetical protein
MRHVLAWCVEAGGGCAQLCSRTLFRPESLTHAEQYDDSEREFQVEVIVMRTKLFWLFGLGCLAAIAAFVEPVFAQGRTLPAPAPLIGMIGLPVAGLVIAAVWLARRWGRD